MSCMLPEIRLSCAPETMGKSAMLGSLEDTLAMSGDLPGVQPCLDFAHLHARPGDGSFNTYDEWWEYWRHIATRLGEAALGHLHVHMSGIEYGEKGEKNHLPLEEADLDVQALFRALLILTVPVASCVKARSWKTMP